MTAPSSNLLQAPKKSRKFSMSSVNKNAWAMRKKLGLPWGVCLKWAWSHAKQKSSWVSVSFVKASTGEVVTRIGTRLRLNSYGNIIFYSISDTGLRSFKPGNLLGIEAF